MLHSLQAVYDQFANGLGLLLATQYSSQDIPENKMVWVYRIIITALLAVLGTFFVASRFLPYPWLEEGPLVKAQITIIEKELVAFSASHETIRDELASIKSILKDLQRRQDFTDAQNNRMH